MNKPVGIMASCHELEMAGAKTLKVTTEQIIDHARKLLKPGYAFQRQIAAYTTLRNEKLLEDSTGSLNDEYVIAATGFVLNFGDVKTYLYKCIITELAYKSLPRNCISDLFVSRMNVSDIVHLTDQALATGLNLITHFYNLPVVDIDPGWLYGPIRISEKSADKGKEVASLILDLNCAGINDIEYHVNRLLVALTKKSSSGMFFRVQGFNNVVFFFIAGGKWWIYEDDNMSLVRREHPEIMNNSKFAKLLETVLAFKP